MQIPNFTTSRPSAHASGVVPEFEFHSVRRIFSDEWLTLAAGAVLTFMLASIFLSGWPAGLIPEIHVPFAYAGDALSSTWLTQRAMEGWVFENDRSGFPFGSSFLDYPGSDAASFLILKLLGYLTGSSAGAMNAYFLLSFPVNFLVAHVVLRSLRISRSLSFAAAVLFAFAPFHFLRMNHTFYTWYFVVPIYFYIGLQVALKGSQLDFRAASWRRRALLIAAYLLMASFGVYYTAFGMLVVAAGSVIALLNRNVQSIRFIAAPVIFFLAIGTAANLAPNVLNEHRLGHNPEVAARQPAESEVYGTKPIQMILPRPGHRSGYLAGLTQHYNSTTPLVNENSTSSLGLFGTLGLAVLLLAATMGVAGTRVDRRLSALTLMSLVLIAFMIVGGLGSLFAHLVSPSIRGWNRASIFLSFSTLAALALVLQYASALISQRLSVRLAAAMAAAMLVVGLWDQTTPACTSCNADVRQLFEQDKAFIAQVEKALPPGAAVYQLPYMGFPESPPIHNLHSYDLATGFIHSRELKWSFAGMRGREGDLFFRSISQLPVSEQLDAIQQKGFDAVYIDTRGYEDDGVAAVEAWTTVLGHGPSVVRPDGRIVVFFLKDAPRTGESSVPFVQLPLRPGQFSAFLDTGWSGMEPWGVWSEGPASTLRLPSPARGATHLRLKFNAFIPNGHSFQIKASFEGGTPVSMVAGRGQAADLTLDLPLPEQREAGMLTVTLHYDKPISPQQANGSGDNRMIAIGLTSLQWVAP